MHQASVSRKASSLAKQVGSVSAPMDMPGMLMAGTTPRDLGFCRHGTESKDKQAQEIYQHRRSRRLKWTTAVKLRELRWSCCLVPVQCGRLWHLCKGKHTTCPTLTAEQSGACMHQITCHACHACQAPVATKKCAQKISG